MHNYEVIINDIETKSISSITELTHELENMRISSEGHISFTPTPAFSDLSEFGILKTSKMKGIFKKRLVQDYYLELNFKYSDGKSGLCGHITRDFNEIKDILSNLITYQKLPDFSKWIMTKFDTDGKALPFEESNPHL